MGHYLFMNHGATPTPVRGPEPDPVSNPMDHPI